MSASHPIADIEADGLLDGREATSHWGYQDLFRKNFPAVHFKPEPNLLIADPGGRIVTAGGTTSWHDLALHIIARHCSPGVALRIAKVYLLKWHGEGQLPFASLVRRQPHADAVVRRAEEWLARNLREPNAVAAVLEACSIPERSLKRRFKAATGSTLSQNVSQQRIDLRSDVGIGSSNSFRDCGEHVCFTPNFEHVSGH